MSNKYFFCLTGLGSFDYSVLMLSSIGNVGARISRQNCSPGFDFVVSLGYCCGLYCLQLTWGNPASSLSQRALPMHC